MCLGKLFTVAEFKVCSISCTVSSESLVIDVLLLAAVLSVLVRNFVFKMRGGPETKIDTLTTILPRPYIVGEDGSSNIMPMRVRHAQLE